MPSEGRSLPARGEVFLWTLRVAEIDPALRLTLRTSLSDEERARADRFKFERDSTLFVAAHALARKMLAAFGVSDPRFRNNAWGKPEIANGGEGLRFNLTHTSGFAACAVATVDDVGVDAEASDRSVDTLGLAKRFFAPGEARLLASLPTERRIDAFYRLWTLKESFIKAVGQGLSIPLDAFFFTLDPFAFDCAPAIACDPRDWQFQSIAHDASYAMAVALHRPGGGSMMIHHETIELNALVPGGEAANSR